MKILIIEDDKALATTLQDGLSSIHNVEIAHTAKKGMEYAERSNGNKYDLILLDLTLPDGDGINLCHSLRAKHITTPILVLSAKQSTNSKVAALDVGADDYLTKPFSFEELFARIRAISRRPKQNLMSNIITVGDVTVDTARHRVERNGVEIPLRRKEFALLEYLARNPKQVVTRQMIIDHVWESDADPHSNTVDVHINYLRSKIQQPSRPQPIKTISGIGYKFEPLEKQP